MKKSKSFRFKYAYGFWGGDAGDDGILASIFNLFTITHAHYPPLLPFISIIFNMETKSEESKLVSVETQTSLLEYSANNSLQASTDVESSTFEAMNVTLPFTPKIVEITPRSKQVPPVNSILA